MKFLPATAALFASVLIAFGAHAEDFTAPDPSAPKILAFNEKAKISTEEVQKAMEAFAQEAVASLNSEKATTIESSSVQPSDSTIQHSLDYRLNAKYVRAELGPNDDLPQVSGYWSPNPNGIVFALIITDHPGLFGASWRKEITVGGKKVDIMYDLDLGEKLAPLSDKINKSIQEMLIRQLLPSQPEGK